ncbi:hypothetical protein [Microbacterium gilvum]|uniref:hypothetical protein n=1 Tax=Microbacterium gilvum TaxID=1336204 RepID=UPI0031F148A2
MALSEREVATLIILIGVLVLILSVRTVRPHLWTVVKTFFMGRLWIPLALYLAYATPWIVGAWLLGMWSVEMSKDTFLVMVTLAVPMLYRAITAPDGDAIVRRAAIDALGVAAFVALYVNLASFAWWAEFILQLLVIVLSVLAAVPRAQEERLHVVARVADFLRLLIGLAMLLWTTVWLVQNAPTVDWALVARTFAMSIWLPAVLMPFAYLFGVYAATEQILTRLRFFNRNQQKPLRVRLAIIRGLRGSLRYARAFRGRWLQQTSELAGWVDTSVLMSRFRAAVRAEQP